MQQTDVVVIGAGQAGLSAAYHLQHRGYVPLGRAEAGERSGEHTSDTLTVEADHGTWQTRYVINATGTWTRPFWPAYPGNERFLGRQLHVHDYVSADEFAGQRVIIVGAGISATQLLEEVSRVADTLWVTRREIEWVDRFTDGSIVESLAEAEARVRQGLPPQSIVRVTGMHRTPWIDRADERGALVRHPMFIRVEERGVRMPDGTFEPADVILWATGFRAELAHFAPLGLRTKDGGIRVENGRSLDEPRLFVIGYGPSQSTVGANRAGRDAVRAIMAEERAGHEAMESLATR